MTSSPSLALRVTVPLGERGSALLAVLWISMGMTALAVALLAVARNAVAPSRNRIELLRAEWHAGACVTYARAALEDTLRRARLEGEAPFAVWMRADRLVATLALPPRLGCTLTARARGSRLDVNHADSLALTMLFQALGSPPATSDSAAYAVIAGRPYDAIRALSRSPLLTRFADLDTLLGPDEGALSLFHAPPILLALLPGIPQELVRRVQDAKRQGRLWTGFTDLRTALSPAARDTLDQHLGALAAAIALQPSAWILTARARAGRPVVIAVVEEVVTRSPHGIGPVRWRGWVE